MKHRPSDEEFAELARKRDEAVDAAIAAICKEQGWDRDQTSVHVSHRHGCYCACPDGPCQHLWDGPNQPIGLEEGEKPEDALCWSITCSRCGSDAMSHDMRCMP